MSAIKNEIAKKIFSEKELLAVHKAKTFNYKFKVKKWITFFDEANTLGLHLQNKHKTTLNLVTILAVILGLFTVFRGGGLVVMVFNAVITSIVLVFLFRFLVNKLQRNYKGEFLFYDKYVASFFILIEEDLKPNSKIVFQANLKNTIKNGKVIATKKLYRKKAGFVSGSENVYEKEMFRGVFFMIDESIVSFNMKERIRRRVIHSKGRVSGRSKIKKKYKSVYPCVVKMKLPKAKYVLKPDLNNARVNYTDEGDFYVFKVGVKFDPKSDFTDKYFFSKETTIGMYTPEYFSMELVNLINVCYQCVIPK